MSHHAAYIVILADDLREDFVVLEDGTRKDVGARAVLEALRMVRGVASVQPVEADYSQVIARSRRDRKWENALLRLIKEGPGEEEP